MEGEEPGVRVFVAHPEERLAYERKKREAAREPARKALEKLMVSGGLKRARQELAALGVTHMESPPVVGMAQDRDLMTKRGPKIGF